MLGEAREERQKCKYPALSKSLAYVDHSLPGESRGCHRATFLSCGQVERYKDTMDELLPRILAKVTIGPKACALPSHLIVKMKKMKWNAGETLP